MLEFLPEPSENRRVAVEVRVRKSAVAVQPTQIWPEKRTMRLYFGAH